MKNDSLTPIFGEFDQLENPPLFTKKSSLADVAAASFQLSFKDAETSSFIKGIGNIAAENDKDIVDHTALNEEYKLPVPLNKPMSKAKFDRLVEEDLERKELQRVIQNGHQDTLESIVNFGAGVAAQIVDPIGIASGFITGTLVAKVLAKGALGARIANRVRKAGKSTLPVNIVEGVAGNILSEVAFVIPVGIQEQQDINVYNNLLNALYGGVGFPVAIKGLGLGVKKLGQLFNITDQRLNAGKKPFGDAIELETITGQAKTQRIKDADELRTKLAKTTDPKEQFEIKKQIDSADEDIGKLQGSLDDAESIRARANDRKQDIYFDSDIAREVSENIEGKEIEIKQVVDDEYERLILDADEGQAEVLLRDKELHNQRREKVPEAIKAATVCIRNALAGKGPSGS